MNPVLVISAKDNVGTAIEGLATGVVVHVDQVRVATREDIPRGHKVALRAIRAGDAVVKYGCPIGTATTDIQPGAHVHVHNVASGRGRGDLMRPSMSTPRIAEPLDLDDRDALDGEHA